MSDSVDFVKGLKKQISENLRVSSLATLVSFDPVSMRADVQPLEAGLPLISDCPVSFPHTGEYFIRLPLKPGDQVMVVFNDYALDGSSKTRHRIDDAVVIGGISLSGAPADHGEDLVIAKKDMTMKIIISEQGVTIETLDKDINLGTTEGDINISSSNGNVNISGKDSSGSW